MKSDYKAIPKMWGGKQIGVTFERRITWRARIKIFLTGRMSWTRYFISDLPWSAPPPKTLKWFPDKPGWNDKKKLNNEIRRVHSLFSPRVMRNARRRLLRMEGKLARPIKVEEE